MTIANFGVSHTLGMMTALSVLMGVAVMMHRLVDQTLVMPFRGAMDKRRFHIPLRGVGYAFGRGMIYVIGMPAGSLAFNWVLFKLFVEQGGMSRLWLVAGLDADLGFVHPPSFILAGLAFLGCMLAMVVCDLLILYYWHVVELISDGLQVAVGIVVRVGMLVFAWWRLTRLEKPNYEKG